MLQIHHFTPQLSENFEARVLDHNRENLKIYDLNAIDYNYIESIYDTKLPQDIINFRGLHTNTNTQIVNMAVYDLDPMIYFNLKPLTKNFYNSHLKQCIEQFYAKDFEVFKSLGFDYTLDL